MYPHRLIDNIIEAIEVDAVLRPYPNIATVGKH